MHKIQLFSEFFKIFSPINRPTTPNLGLRSFPDETIAREKHTRGFRRGVLHSIVGKEDENPEAVALVAVASEESLLSTLSICRYFSVPFRFADTLYIYSENPPASRGEVRVGCRARGGRGVVAISHYPVPLFRLPLSSFLLYLQEV